MEPWAAFAVLFSLLALGSAMLVVARCIKPRMAGRPGGPLQLADVLGQDFDTVEIPWQVDLLQGLITRMQLVHPNEAPILTAVEEDLWVAVNEDQLDASAEMVNSFETNITELRWLAQHIYNNAVSFKEGQELDEDKELANEVRFFVRILERRVIQLLALATRQLGDEVRMAFAVTVSGQRARDYEILNDYKPLVAALRSCADNLVTLAEGELGGCELDGAAEAAKAMMGSFHTTFGKRYDQKAKKWEYDHRTLQGINEGVQDTDLIKREKLNDLKILETRVRNSWGKHIEKVVNCLNDFLFEEVLVTEERGSLLQGKQVRRFLDMGARFSWAFRTGEISDFDPVGGLYSVDWRDGPFAGTTTDMTWFELRYALMDTPKEVEEKPPDDENSFDTVLWKYFMQYDLDKSGFIDDEREVHAICTHVIYQRKVKIKADVIKERCLSADDCMNYEEFRSWFLQTFPEADDRFL